MCRLCQSHAEVIAAMSLSAQSDTFLLQMDDSAVYNVTEQEMQCRKENFQNKYMVGP